MDNLRMNEIKLLSDVRLDPLIKWYFLAKGWMGMLLVDLTLTCCLFLVFQLVQCFDTFVLVSFFTFELWKKKKKKDEKNQQLHMNECYSVQGICGQ